MSKEDIARKYDLPERQSKIALLMKQEDHGLDEQVYCICRTSDVNRFMIGCDYCEEWFHGDCIDVTEEEARFIKKFFCSKCRQRDPSLTIKYKQKKLEHASAKDSSESSRKAAKKRTHEGRKSSTATAPANDYPQCGECIACYRVDDCGRCDACRSNKSSSRQQQQQCKTRVCLTFAPKRKADTKSDDDEASSKAVLKESNYSDEDVWEPSLRKEAAGGGGGGKSSAPAAKPSRHSTKKEKGSKGGRHRSSAATGDSRSRRKRIASGSDLDDSLPAAPTPNKSKEIIHCHGPGCINSSRPGSKYCSDQCGLNLATARIYQILPSRIQEWNLTPCTAEEKNKKELEHIRKQQNDARSILEDLDIKTKELDELTARTKRLTVDKDADDEAEEVGEGEAEAATVQCVTCGMGLTVRNAIRHMERCFNKYESQTSFGSIFQTKIEGNNPFCDFYNPSNGTYCKRLRVLCPEHCKDPKVSDSDVCGYPLVADVFQETGDFCRVRKKNCVKHNNWEKLRRAELDMERVRQWLKMDELFEKERQIRTAMAQRAGLLPLILHSTFNHEAMQQMASQQHQQQSGGNAGGQPPGTPDDADRPPTPSAPAEEDSSDSDDSSASS